MNKKQNKLKQRNVLYYERGITLIALVVTIVVLLILAGITINMLFSENGIIKKAQDAKEATESSQADEITRINQIESQIDRYITETSNNNSLTKIVGKLDVTYRVEGTKVYFYPTIDGYHNLTAYCSGKVIQELENIITDEQKEQFVINYVNVFEGTDVTSPEKALEIINSDLDEPYDSCAEIINELLQNLNNMNKFELLLYYFILKYDKIPASEKDSLALLGCKFELRMSETELKFKTVEDLLKFLNNKNNTSYTSLKDALGTEYSLYIGLGLLYGATDINLEHNGQVVTIDFDKLLSDEEIVLEYDMGLENKGVFTISNAFESKTFEINIEKQLNEYGFYYNTFYKLEMTNESASGYFLFYFFDDHTCLNYTYYKNKNGEMSNYSIDYWSLSENENKITVSLFTFIIVNNGTLSCTDSEGKALETLPVLNENINLGTPKKNEEYGYYESALYIAENPEDIASNSIDSKVIKAIIIIDSNTTVTTTRVEDNGIGITGTSGDVIEYYQVSDDGRTISTIESEGPIIIYKLLNGVYDLQ